MHVLVEGLAEAFDRQAAAVVLVPAEVVTRVQLVHLQGHMGKKVQCSSFFDLFLLNGLVLNMMMTDAVMTCRGLSRRRRLHRTCMPHTLTPSVAEVLCSHFFICLAAFSSEASSPCCLVPIFRSRMQG